MNRRRAVVAWLVVIGWAAAETSAAPPPTPRQGRAGPARPGPGGLCQPSGWYNAHGPEEQEGRPP
jgi:hypothetical protein